MYHKGQDSRDELISIIYLSSIDDQREIQFHPYQGEHSVYQEISNIGLFNNGVCRYLSGLKSLVTI